MSDIDKIIAAFDQELIKTKKPYLTLESANKVLLSKDIISYGDNVFLKNLLQNNQIPHAYRADSKLRPWRIPISEISRSIYESELKKNQKPEDQFFSPTWRNSQGKLTPGAIFFIIVIILIIIILYVNEESKSPEQQRREYIEQQKENYRYEKEKEATREYFKSLDEEAKREVDNE